MHVEHFEKGIRYSDRDLLTLARKIGKLATYCKQLKDESSLIRVEAERRATKKQNDEVKVMITVDLPGSQLRGESRRSRPLEAVDRCIEKLKPQIKRYKEKHTAKQKAHEDRRRRAE